MNGEPKEEKTMKRKQDQTEPSPLILVGGINLRMVN